MVQLMGQGLVSGGLRMAWSESHQLRLALGEHEADVIWPCRDAAASGSWSAESVSGADAGSLRASFGVY